MFFLKYLEVIHILVLPDVGLILDDFSFTTDPISIGLNVALGEPLLQSNNHTFGIPEAIASPSLCAGFLKGLKYSDDSFTASLSPA